ncbi:formate/nitrite transporter family protein [Paenibacillus gallinarum]|uniref:Formate/nitrite transporter family protein n=1 Tax=Paenibacillus gallinarum TaxID=2762232 RepID=A0ABR8SZV1_9BACL|nr:formate/nitrite transporter family protein [Paenibacillus gallinarum]MBD7969033.1 formate/nitrite transporter family protein [Paenibacillus gallinarum]
MGALKPATVAELTADTGEHKAHNPANVVLILGFLAGAYIALGYLLYIRVIAAAPEAWGSMNGLIGALVFPIGLTLVLIAGGELLTGNMMALSLARLARKITTRELFWNLTLVTFSNFVGAVFVAYLFGHVLGLTGQGIYLDKVVDLAGHKIDESFLQAFVSGIGCNWLVALAVWLAYAADSMSAKIVGIWIPTTAFVALGFQHVVANMFLIPAAIFEGHFTWGQYIMNFIPVWLGNLTGGAIFVAAAYYAVYLHKPASTSVTKEEAETPVSSSPAAMQSITE